MLKMSYPSKISRVFVYPSLPSLRVRVQEGYKICTLTPTPHLPLLKPPGFIKPLTITNLEGPEAGIKVKREPSRRDQGLPPPACH